MAAQARGDDASHPSVDELLAYQGGGLPEAAAERMRDHLALCPGCARLLLDRYGSRGLGRSRGAPRRSRQEVARRWETLRARLVESGDIKVESVSRDRSWRRLIPLSLDPLPLALGAVALLAVVCLGLSLRLLSLDRRLEELRGPHSAVVVNDLLPTQVSGDRALGGEQTVRVPRSAERVVLILNLFELRTFPRYRVEVLSSRAGERETIWGSDGLMPAESGSFAIEFPRGFLPAGNLEIELSGLAGDREERLAAYALRLAYE